MRTATDADFNSRSRQIEVKLDIYFDGMMTTPFTVSKSDYLIDVEWLEEISADSSNPLGVISSNELSFRLFNKDGIFSPTNTLSPHYGKIKAGIIIALYVRTVDTTDEVEWTQLGMYLTTGWDAQITGTYADITANDIWYYLFNNVMVDYPVTKDITYYALLTEVFDLLGSPVPVDVELNTVLPYAFISKSTKTFLKDALSASLAYATCTKEGLPVVEAFLKERTLRATLTDADQIKSMSVKQSINRAHDGVELSYVIPNLSELTNLVTVTNLTVPVGTTTVSGIEYQNSPVWDVLTVIVRDASGKVSLSNYQSTQDTISITVNNKGNTSIPINVYVYGQYIELASVILSDNGAAPLKISNKYIQSVEHANVVKSVMQKYNDQDIPTLTVPIRGNPLLSIGEKVNLSSAKYNVNFTGIIQRLSYKYNGSLDCVMSVINAAIFE